MVGSEFHVEMHLQAHHWSHSCGDVCAGTHPLALVGAPGLLGEPSPPWVPSVLPQPYLRCPLLSLPVSMDIAPSGTWLLCPDSVTCGQL